MNYIIKNGIKCHWDSRLVPNGYSAIMLFGHVFFPDNEELVRMYLKTKAGEITINHERIHVLQAESFKTKYFGFYILYTWYWFIGLFKYGTTKYESYKNIPFEREAYANETNMNYTKSNWKEYI